MSRRKRKRVNQASQQAEANIPINTPSTGSAETAGQQDAASPGIVEPTTKVTFTHEEYKDLSDNIRHYNTHFLALITVFLAIVAGLLRIVFGDDRPVNDTDRVVGCIVGIVLAACFWFQGETYLYRQRKFEDRLRTMEPQLGYQQYSTLLEHQPRRFFRRLRLGRWFWRVFFACSAGLWVYGIIRMHTMP